MNLKDVIELFEEMEVGKTGQMLGFHLHKPIAQALSQNWRTNQNYPETFSGFLKALKDQDEPK
jgi:hypothetical protein